MSIWNRHHEQYNQQCQQLLCEVKLTCIVSLHVWEQKAAHMTSQKSNPIKHSHQILWSLIFIKRKPKHGKEHGAWLISKGLQRVLPKENVHNGMAKEIHLNRLDEWQLSSLSMYTCYPKSPVHKFFICNINEWTMWESYKLKPKMLDTANKIMVDVSRCQQSWLT